MPTGQLCLRPAPAMMNPPPMPSSGVQAHTAAATSSLVVRAACRARCSMNDCQKLVQPSSSSQLCRVHSRPDRQNYQCSWTRARLAPASNSHSMADTALSTRNRANVTSKSSLAIRGKSVTRAAAGRRESSHTPSTASSARCTSPSWPTCAASSSSPRLEDEVRCRRAEQEWRKMEHQGHADYTQQLLVTAAIATGETADR